MGKSKQSKAREFSPAERYKIEKRDRGKCIFCELGYRTSNGTWFGKEIKSIMHYIPRSKKRPWSGAERGSRMPISS